MSIETQAELERLWDGNSASVNSVLGRLVDELLFEFSDDAGSKETGAPDGILFSFQDASADTFSGAGMAIYLPDSNVEPVMFDLSFGSETRTLIHALIQFGWQGWQKCQYHSSRHDKASDLLAAGPRAERAWIWTFTYRCGRWSAQRSLPPRIPQLWPSAD